MNVVDTNFYTHCLYPSSVSFQSVQKEEEIPPRTPTSKVVIDPVPEGYLPLMSDNNLQGNIISRNETMVMTDPNLYLFIKKPINVTEKMLELKMPRWKRDSIARQKRRERIHQLTLLRQSLPANTVQTPNHSPLSSTYAFRPISSFFTADSGHGNRSVPMLVDAFSYCENNSLVVEAILNLRYVYAQVGRSYAHNAMYDQWYCEYRNETQLNLFPVDTHKHIIVTLFRFPQHCQSPFHSIHLYSNRTNYHYYLDVEFLPSFTSQRYYLSICTMLEIAPLGQVRVFLNHYLALGVEHFVFYLNGRYHYWQAVLQKYIQNGILEIVDFAVPDHGPFYEQAAAINSCNRRQRYATQFMIFLDVDEFLIPMNRTWKLTQVVRLYDEVFPFADAFSVRNVFYSCDYSGTEYQWTNAKCITDVCTMRAQSVVKGERQKNIVRPRTVPYVQVHLISYGYRMYVDHNLDLYMLHLKNGMRRFPGIPIDVDICS